MENPGLQDMEASVCFIAQCALMFKLPNWIGLGSGVNY